MLAEFIVLFRESLEIAFVVSIILAYLHKTKNEDHEKHVWLGVAAGLVASIGLAFIFQFVQGGFSASEELFEGFFLILTSGLVSWLVLWMLGQKKVVDSLTKDVKVALEKKETLGLFLLAFTSTLREGVESVLFLAGIYVNTGAISLVGGFMGAVAAIVLGVLIFEYAINFNVGRFFKITTVILILLAAGLFSQGIHELQEAHILPTYVEHVYDINPPQNSDGSYPLLHEKGPIGSIFKGLIGYDGNPSDLQLLSYFGYLLTIYAIYRSKS
ncbi:FTR1 family protein [Candidatus Micrarchaeota archaeon]|nr:FTR1 family protein [Candidatus Micrarchaeota archaeon]